MISGTRILIVEDDEDLASLVALNLSDRGYAVSCVANGKDGLSEALTGLYELVILDVMMPGMDGFEVCQSLRSGGSRIPVLMLTARSEELDRVMGLEIGADDYLTKPFSVRELLARVKALLRRVEMDAPEASGKDEDLHFGDLVISPQKRTVVLAGEALELTAKEFDLLTLFARNPGRAFSRQDLLDQVWGYQYEGYSHTVNTHINRLRSKLGDDPAAPRFIKTVWGHGYGFIESEGAVS